MGEIVVEQLDAIWVAAMRHDGPHDPGHTDATWNDLIVWASPRKLLGRALDMRGVGLVWDDPRQFMPSQIRYDVGVPIDPEDEDLVDDPAFVLVTAPGSYLRATHIGSYDSILRTYDLAIGGPLRYEAWALLAQPIIEVYRDSPAEVGEDDLRTDIYFPVIRMPS